MKKLFAIFAIAALATGCNDPEPQQPPLPDDILAEITDPVFRAYAAYCMENEDQIFVGTIETFPVWDINRDGKLSPDEAAKVTHMEIDPEYINGELLSCCSLSGIEYFTGLVWLDCLGNDISSLDVSKNTALIRLNCSANNLVELNVSKNKTLAYLYCGANELSSLDISDCTALIDIDCVSNKLTSLDISKNNSLLEITCSWNELTSLDLSECTALAALYCSYNRLATLDVSKNIALSGLFCSSNQLTQIDVSQNIELATLECADNKISMLDISQCVALKYLLCIGNPGAETVFTLNARFDDDSMPSGFFYNNIRNPDGGDYANTYTWEYEGATISTDFQKVI